MCGITAAFYPDDVPAPSPDGLRSSLNASLERINYRGPDSRGIYISQNHRVGLGHVRLSIIDLETGQQPLSDEDESIHAVVNGEIYDHDRIRAEMQAQGYSFKTKSDSELVVQLYKRDGTNLLSHLRGEYAFVLYDAKRRVLFAARDRFGIKPLFYTLHDGAILFASEMKAFLGFGWKPRWNMDVVKHLWPTGDDRTVFHGAKPIPAGSFLLARASGDLQIQNYWDISFPDAKAVPTESVDAMISRTRELMVDAVRLRLRSDVPLAVYLSGGVDSSAVAGIATELLHQKNPNARLTAFTLSYLEDPANDETAHAEHTAAHLGAELVKVPATEQLLVEALDESTWHNEHPTSILHAAGKALLSKAVRDAGFKVVLSGEGADEIFAGYPFSVGDYLQAPDAAGEALGLELPSEAERQAIAQAYTAMTKLPLRTASVLNPEKANAPRPLVTTASHLFMLSPLMSDGVKNMFHPKIVQQMNPRDAAWYIEEGISPVVRENSVSGRWHPLNVSLYVTSKTFLARNILTAGDRADMTHSIEGRVPFLDHYLVEYVSSLPPSLKLKPVAKEGPRKWELVEKWIQRQAARPYITNEVYTRKKVPFNPPPRPVSDNPTEAPVLTPLQAHFKARVTKERVEALGFFRWPAVSKLLEGYLAEPKEALFGDPRARLLLTVLGYIVLQERFGVPTYEVV
ncbi:Asparagine synthase [Mycena chlorophos]|uniref:Asparagine synthase n=1 Tax=Mycena chlorophos TaxID=658473 RepID=A0A8H6SBW4_MYCCL|nr:Asparagine synthase [Mycena chlorophos]